MTFARRTIVVASIATLAGCSGADLTRGNADAASPHSTLAVAPTDSTARGVIRATIVGDRLVHVTPDTAGADSVKVPEHIAGAEVAVYEEIRDSSATEGLKGVSDTRIGTLVSDSAGVILLTSVPKGYYRLDVTPPASGPYRPGSIGMESLTGADVFAVIVELHSR